jgi:hypothetical protein
MKMQVVIVEPGKAPKVTHIENTLEAMQQTVGGLIELFRIDDEIVIIHNEESKLGGFRPNKAIWYEDDLIDIVFGTFFVCSAPVYNADISGLTDEQAMHYTMKFCARDCFF